MKVARSVSELRKLLAGRTRIGFVPTMGALHNGHAELLRRCVSDCDTSVVSIFVNPTQFGANEDLARYPRTEAKDLALVSSINAGFAFIPDASETYSDDGVWVEVGNLANTYEGAIRPGHFRGVATVVLKLFEMVRPNVAYFGLKDLQQCAVVSELVRSFFLPIELEFIETVRESDGLAMSSRNAYLSGQDRARAPRLFKAISEVASRIDSGLPIENAIQEVRCGEFQDIAFDYLDVVDSQRMMRPGFVDESTRVIAAARFGDVRLIDNCAVKV